MKNVGILLVVLITCCLRVQAQSGDSLRTYRGIVLDIISKKPVPAVIVYETMPYGETVGVTRSNPEDGSFDFQFFDRGKYTLSVHADSFRVRIDSIDASIVSNSNNIDKRLYLIPEGSGSTLRLNKLTFDQGEFDIREESYEELDEIVLMMRENPDMVIQLEGHTDYRGSARLNLELSENRTEAVKTYLVNKDISPMRIRTKAYGGTQPLSRESTDEARQMNMRVEVRIIQN